MKAIGNSIKAYSCCPREGRGLHPGSRERFHRRFQVAVPARGAGCIEKQLAHPLPTCQRVAVPARGAGCIERFSRRYVQLCEEAVAVPVRGAGCILTREEAEKALEGSCRPRKGRGLHLNYKKFYKNTIQLPSPRGVRVVSC